MKKYYDYEDVENTEDDDLVKELDFDSLVLEAQEDCKPYHIPQVETVTASEHIKKLDGGDKDKLEKDMSPLKW